MRLKYKILLYAGGWLAALFATDPSGRLWPLAWMFPLGLAAFVRRQLANSGGWGVFGACIGIYVVHAYFYFRAKQLRTTWILSGVLVLLFLCNVAGCRAMLNTH